MGRHAIDLIYLQGLEKMDNVLIEGALLKLENEMQHRLTTNLLPKVTKAGEQWIWTNNDSGKTNPTTGNITLAITKT